MRIWVDENIPQGREAFAAHGEVTVFAGRSLQKKDILGADALIIRSITKINAGLLDGTPVSFVGTATIGTDHVDMDYLRSKRIGFSAAPGCNSNSVGEYVTASLAHLESKHGFSTRGKTMGIIGYGHVGKQVERKALALGLRVLRNDPPLEEIQLQVGQAGEMKATEFHSLEQVLAESDIITLHIPLIRNGPHPTYRLAGEDFFSRLGKRIVLMNSCRGEVMDEGALLKAKASGLVRHLILDVFDGEPNINSIVCAAADIVTPHIAGYSLQGKLGGTTQIAAAFRAHFGKTDAWFPAYSPPAEAEIRYVPTNSPEGDLQFVRASIFRAYDIMADDRRLRLALREVQPGAAFDRLRRDYPVRDEFPQYRVTGIPSEKRDLHSQLVELGFRVEGSSS